MTINSRAVRLVPGIHRPMRARAVDEAHRAATPLELLFDLTFVIAVAHAASYLAHAIVEGDAAETAGPFFMVFFAIWWAWMTFTWFASAYDVDDVPYRVATFVQIWGVLVLAAGVRPAFESGEYTAITTGYVIMRVGLLSLWLRAARQHPSSRGSSIRYAVGLVVLTLLWVVRLGMPPVAATVAFLVLAILELAVPIWAERHGGTSWHPHHIAERYGLFTLIILGESVYAATNAAAAVVEDSAGRELVVVSVAGLVIIGAVWWLYFLVPAGPGLEARRSGAFLWSYSHYVVYAALAVLGAGLEAVVTSTGDHHHGAAVHPAVLIGAVALPIAVVVAMLGVLHVPSLGKPAVRPATTTAIGALALVVLAADALGAAASLSLVALVVVGLLVADLAMHIARSEQRVS